MIAELQCLPDPKGTADSAYAHVDAAIAVVRRAGLSYRVGALGTTFEGPPEAVWPVLREAHEAALKAGAGSVVSVIKVAESSGDTLSMDDLTEKYGNRP